MEKRLKCDLPRFQGVRPADHARYNAIESHFLLRGCRECFCSHCHCQILYEVFLSFFSSFSPFLALLSMCVSVCASGRVCLYNLSVFGSICTYYYLYLCGSTWCLWVYVRTFVSACLVCSPLSSVHSFCRLAVCSLIWECIVWSSYMFLYKVRKCLQWCLFCLHPISRLCTVPIRLLY